MIWWVLFTVGCIGVLAAFVFGDAWDFFIDKPLSNVSVYLTITVIILLGIGTILIGNLLK